MSIELPSHAEIEKEGGLLSLAQHFLSSSVEEASSNNVPVLLLLSGGSSLALLEGLDTKNFDGNVTIAPLDERYSNNPSENNMAQIADTKFFKEAQRKGVGIIDTRVMERESREGVANRFNSQLLLWIRNNPAGKIIATVGVGPDGHVSGIMPYPEAPEKFREMFDDKNEEHLVVGYDAGTKNQYSQRVTTTMNFLRKIDTAIVYAVGDSKRDAVGKVLAKEGDLATTPARILKELQGRVRLFTDQN